MRHIENKQAKKAERDPDTIVIYKDAIRSRAYASIPLFLFLFVFGLKVLYAQKIEDMAAAAPSHIG